MGQPDPGNSGSSYAEFIGIRGERGEVKHLSTPRKRNQIEIPSVAASERGKAQTAGSNSIGVVGLSQGVAQEITKPGCNRRLLERTTVEGDSPVDEMALVFLETVPEYRGTREIPREAGRTIFQG